MTGAPANRILPARRVRALAAILVIAAATLAIGCFDKESKPKVVIPDPLAGYRPDTSADNVVWNLWKSWAEFNYAAYQTFLSNDFTFVFAPQDVGGPDNNPESWGRLDELLSAAHLFSKTTANKEGYVATSASLTFEMSPDTANDMNGWTKVVLRHVFLTVTSRHQTTGDPLDYVIQGDQGDLWLAKENGVWRVIRWEDKPVGWKGNHSFASLGTMPSTWGEIKGLFH